MLTNNRSRILALNGKIISNSPPIPSVIKADNSHNSLISQNTLPVQLSPEAYHGLVGNMTKAIEPHTEADPASLILQFLVAFGNVIDKKPHFCVESDYHALKISCVLVGKTAKGRKGTAWGHIKHIFNIVCPEWVKMNLVSGLSSGEGLIWAVRNSTIEGEDQGIADKRLLAVEPEFATVLRRISNQGNTLSALIRESWDGDSFQIVNKNSPVKATGTHISIIGHITEEELLRYLDRTEMANGFGNRLLWAYVGRSKCLPDGGRLKEVDLKSITDQLRKAIDFAAKTDEIKRDVEANKVWHKIYPLLSEGRPGMVGALTARGEAYTMRLACIYALLDCSTYICLEHLNAALAIWHYSEASVYHIFEGRTGNPDADMIYEALKTRPKEGLNRTEISGLFERHKPSEYITGLLKVLQTNNKVRKVEISTRGRMEERWLICAK